MALANETVSPLAQRLLTRNENRARVGAGSRLFERFGVTNPYDAPSAPAVQGAA